MVLVSHWPLQTDNGSTATDIEGPNDGDVVGPDPGVTGVLGGSAYGFDGSGDYVQAPGPTLTGECTFGGWFRVDDLSSDQFLIATYDGTIAGFELRLRFNKGDAYAGSYDGSTAYRAYLNASQFKTTGWYHLMGRYDGQWDLFVNGRQATDNRSTDQSKGAVENDYHVRLGRQANTDYGPFDGAMTGIRVYSHALSRSAIQLLSQIPIHQGVLVTAAQQL